MPTNEQLHTDSPPAEIEPTEYLPALETLAGIERQLYYNAEKTTQLITQHREFANHKDLQHPYFDYTDQKEAMLFEVPVQDGMVMRVGRIGAFSKEQMARFINEQTVNYVFGGTMGKNFPKDDPQKVEELLAMMMDGFSESNVIVIFEKQSKDGINPVAGVRGYYGTSNLPVKDIMLSHEPGETQPESSLATYQALKIPKDYAPQIRPFLDTYGDTPESETICMSRLYKQTGDVLKQLEVNERDLPWLAMAALPLGIVTHGIQHPELVPAKIALYDTHNGKIQSHLRESFDMRLLTPEGKTIVTQEVLDTILYYHYTSQTEGGFMEELVTGYAVVPDYVIRAIQYLQDHHISVGHPELNKYLEQIVNPNGLTPELSQLVKNSGYDIKVISKLREAAASYPEKPSPEQFKPEIIDHHTDQGKTRLAELTYQITENVLIHPFNDGLVELQEMATRYTGAPENETDMIDLVVNELLKETKGIRGSDIREVVKAMPTAKDRAWLVSQVHKLKKPGRTLEQSIEDDSRYIFNPVTKKLTKFVGPDAHRILRRSRLVGLIPFEALDHLEEMNIGSIGASAVAMSLVHLGALGASHIEIHDDGLIATTNGTRFPPEMSGIEQIQQPKSLAIQSLLYKNNPYGDYKAFVGRVVESESHKQGPYDVTYEQFANGKDCVFEVADNRDTKEGWRLWAEEHAPDLLTVFVADTDKSIAGLERPGDGNHFNANLSTGTIFEIKNTMPDISNLDNPTDIMRAHVGKVLGDVSLMLRNDLPNANRVQFIMAYLFGDSWSQTSISAHQSAEITGKLLLHHANGNETIIGNNYTTADAPATLMPPLSHRQSETLRKILTQLFELPEFALPNPD